jgi:hypothetical protein
MSILTPKTAGFVNLIYCVASVQSDIKDFSDRNVEQFTQWAINAYTEINLFHSNNVEVVYLTMDSNGIVDISSLTDYIDYVKVGIPVNGKIWILNCNEKILLNRTELDASEAALIFKTGAPDIDVSSGYFFADHYINGNYTTGVFGMGGGFSRSFFRIDKEKKQIQFATSVPRTQIILEYISTGVNATGGTLIPRQCVGYVKGYIRWQMEENNPMATRFDKDRKERQFYDQEAMMDNFDQRFNMEEYLNSMYSTYKQTPKM